VVRSVNTLKNIDNSVDSTVNNTIDNTKNSDVNGDSYNNSAGNFTIEKSSEEIQIDFEVKSIQPTTENNIIHLLIAHEDPSEANKIKNIYKNSGWIVNAHRITSVEDLDESLTNKRWNILLAFGHSKLYLPAVIGNAIKKNNAQLRAIYLDKKYSSTNALQIFRCGFCDYLTAQEHDRLLHVTKREIQAQEDHRIAIASQSVMEETNARSQLLMDSTADAVAYIIDGMIVHSNSSFSKQLNFSSPDELDCLPFIDLVSTDDHKTLKPLLRKYQLGEQQESSITLDIVKADTETMQAELLLAMASFEGEACTQIILRSAINDENTHQSDFDLEVIQNLEGKGSLFFASITSNAVQRKKLGLHNHLRLIKEIGDLLRDFIPTEAKIIDYLKESWIIVIPNSHAHEPAELATELCQRVNSATIGDGEQCITPSIAVGISKYGVAGITIENALDQAFKASAEKQMDGKSGYKVFSPKIDNAEGAEALRSALELNRFRIKYQPIIALQNQSKHTYDTVLYIENDAGSDDIADDLLASLGIEKTNAELDRWMINEIINTLSTSDNKNIQLNIPLTASAIMDDSFYSWLTTRINNSEINSASLIFSMTISDATDYEKNALSLIKKLKEAGHPICLTNANADYIDLIQKLMPDTLKLTAQLTEKMNGEDAEPELIKSMITLAKENNATCIATDVNSAGDLAQLWQTGIGFVQGNYLQAPQDNMDYDFSDIG
jgi:EAL domain-containing protein (putative c-di-GMP-specific phosphodiesterase class I)/GGDEF domain-containing protein/PAS domain-containing protein